MLAVWLCCESLLLVGVVLIVLTGARYVFADTASTGPYFVYLLYTQTALSSSSIFYDTTRYY